MNLLPIANPTAPGNVLGADHPAATGSGDFAALVAMLVATASTTLPVGRPPGGLAGSGEAPEEPLPLLPATNIAGPEAPTPAGAPTVPYTTMPAGPDPAVPAVELGHIVATSPAPPVETAIGPVAGLTALLDPDTAPPPAAQPAPPTAQPLLPASRPEGSPVETDSHPLQDREWPMAQVPIEETLRRVAALDDAPRPANRADDPRNGHPAVELPTPMLSESKLPEAAAVSRGKPDHVGRSATPSIPTVAGDMTEQRPDVPAPAPEKAEGLPASKIAVVPSASQGAAHPVVPLVAAARSEALVPVETPPAAPAVPASVPEQIVSAVVPLHGRGDGRHEVTLELRPDNLGAIRVEVSVEHQTVHLTLHAAEPATGRLLAAALPDLRSALADAGLTAGQLGVGPDGGGGAGQRRSRPTAEPESRLPHSPRRTGTDESDPVRTVRPVIAGRLDLFL